MAGIPAVLGERDEAQVKAEPEARHESLESLYGRHLQPALDAADCRLGDAGAPRERALADLTALARFPEQIGESRLSVVEIHTGSSIDPAIHKFRLIRALRFLVQSGKPARRQVEHLRPDLTSRPI